MNRLIFTSLFLFLVINNVDSAKILVVYAFPAHSHFTLGFKLAKGLADKGHEVTFVSPYPQKKPIPNFKDVSVADIIPEFSSLIDDLYEMGKKSYIGQLHFLCHGGFKLVDLVLNHKNVKHILDSNEKFDLVILEQFLNDGLAIIPYKLNCPYILVAPGPTTVFNNRLFANPAPPSYIPNLLSPFGSDMNIWQRLVNTYYDIAGELHSKFYVIPKHNEIVHKAIPDAPDLNDILYNASLMFTSSHPSINEPVPLQQNIKEIGGHHVSKPNPLPKDLKEFLDKATEGVILFSMGSNLRSADFPEATKSAILNTFAKIKQKVLWKFETNLPGRPKNVKIVDWMPQNDVLAHPNVVAFISHGGLLGNIEAVYHGVPILGISVYWDQEPNMNAAANKGYGIHLKFTEITQEKFSYALSEILNNSKYIKGAKRQQKIMQDRILKPLDEAIYWVEYVIRHDGAPHLRSAGLKLNWFQRYLIDIVFLIALLFLFVVKIIKLVFLKKSNNTSNVKMSVSKKRN